MKLTVAQASLELTICLLQAPECWGYRCPPPHPLKEVSCQVGTWGKLCERAIVCYKRQKQIHWGVDHKSLTGEIRGEATGRFQVEGLNYTLVQF